MIKSAASSRRKPLLGGVGAWPGRHSGPTPRAREAAEGFSCARSAGTDFDVLEEYVCRVHGKRVDICVDLAASEVKLSLVIRIGRNDSDMIVDAGRDQLADEGLKAGTDASLLFSHTL